MGILEKMFSKRNAVVIADEGLLSTPNPKTEVKSKSDLLTYKIFVAWSNKYEGEKQIMRKIEAMEVPYKGLKGSALRQKVEDSYHVNKYPIQEGYDVYFKDEPDNDYNSNAIAIMSEEHGKLGYVPDKNISRVRGILSKDKYEAKWIYTCKEKKCLDEDDRIVTENIGQSRLEVQFKYTRTK